MAENADDILDLHANESEEDSFENTLSESNDLNLLFGEDTQFPVSQVQTRARSNTITRPTSVVATNTNNKQSENTETGISRKKVKNNKRSVKAPLSKVPKRSAIDKSVFSNSEILKLKSKLGINTIMNPVNTLSDAVHALITNHITPSQASANKNKSSHKTSTVSRPPNEPIISLDSNLSPQSHNETLNDFDINLFNSENQNNLFDDVQATPCDFVTPDVGSHFEYERASSYDPNDIFGKAMGNEETDVIKWDLPQLDTEEKTGLRVLDKLATAVNAAESKRSVKEAISNIAKKYFRPVSVHQRLMLKYRLP
jgi:hypothetical protein